MSLIKRKIQKLLDESSIKQDTFNKIVEEINKDYDVLPEISELKKMSTRALIKELENRGGRMVYCGLYGYYELSNRKGIVDPELDLKLPQTYKVIVLGD